MQSAAGRINLCPVHIRNPHTQLTDLMGRPYWDSPLARQLASPSIWSVLVPDFFSNSCTGSSGRSHLVPTDVHVLCVVGVDRLSSTIIVYSANLHPVRAIHVVNPHIVFGVRA